MYRIQLKMHGGRWHTAMTFQTMSSVRIAVGSFTTIMGGSQVRVQMQRGRSRTVWTEVPWEVVKLLPTYFQPRM